MKGEKMKSLVFYPDRCLGCRICETICAVEHVGMINPERSRIKVIKNDERGLDVVNVCLQCEEAPCVASCPVDAISRNNDYAININQELCSLCGLCVEACPYGGISLDEQSGEFIVCDLCGGNPTCVEWCPTNAIQYTQLSEGEKKKISEAHLSILQSVEKTEVLQ